MIQIKLKPIVEESLHDIINNYKDSVGEYNYIYPEFITTDSILFIGINPSADSDKITGIENSYAISDTHRYFKKFPVLAEYCNTDWTHLDLLYFRETNQKQVESLLKTKNGCDFIYQQLQITKGIIEQSNPKVIIVNNAFAANFLGKNIEIINEEETNVWLGYKFEFNNDLGTHTTVINNRVVPVFFTSMLTGQRALDNGSFERLKWHVKRTIDLINSPTN